MIMELLEGETLLAHVRKRGRLPVAEAVAIVRQMAEALAAAHAQHVVHRDLKPENVFLVTDRDAPLGVRAKILDFGIAKMLDPASSAPHTKTGSILGTPIYMSPEQCTAAPKIDHRADLYSLGCVFFHLVCGRPPFNLDGIGELLGAHVYTAPPVPSSLVASIPHALDEILLKLLQKKPDDRYASMGELLTALDGVPQVGAAAEAAAAATAPAGGVQYSAPDAATIMQSPGTAAPKPEVPRPAAAAPATPAPEMNSQKTLALPPRIETPAKETTTLGGAAGESQRPAIPQPERRRMSSMVTMGIAFGLTITLALGGFFLLGGRHSASSELPAVHQPPPPPVVLPVALTVESNPAGAEVWRDGAKIGVTPFVSRQAPGPGDAHFVIKMAGYDDMTLDLKADRDGQGMVTLTPKK
jgi:serine/threonine-protein kinase